MIQESELGKRIKAYRMKKGLTLRSLKKKPASQKRYLFKGRKYKTGASGFHFDRPGKSF